MNELLFMDEVDHEDAIIHWSMKCDHDTTVLDEISAWLNTIGCGGIVFKDL
jgi:hypothetical protein